MMTTTMAAGSNTQRLMSHYAAVKARLHAPVNMPARNRLKAVLAEAEARKRAQAPARAASQVIQKLNADLKNAERVRRYMKKKREAEGDGAARRRRRKVVPSIEALTDPELTMHGCPFKPRNSPVLHEAVKTVLNHYKVTWAAIVSSVRLQHLVDARAAVYTLLREAGFTSNRIARMTSRKRDATSITRLVREYGEKVWDSACFFDAISCLKDISEGELELWGLPPIKTETETHQEIE